MSDDPRLIAIVRVVHGELDWRALREFGIGVDVGLDAVREFASVPSPVKISAIDAARGWLRLAGDPIALREWARFVHGAIGLVELSVDDHPLGDKLLGNIWDVAFGEPITGQMGDVARRIAVSAM